MLKWLSFTAALLVQLAAFYLFPRASSPGDEMGLVFIIIIITFINGFFLGCMSGGYVKYAYPVITAVVFIPTVYIYYNSSALIHSFWYFAVSFTGLFIGTGIRELVKFFVDKE